jgi:hypothetical protein
MPRRALQTIWYERTDADEGARFLRALVVEARSRPNPTVREQIVLSRSVSANLPAQAEARIGATVLVPEGKRNRQAAEDAKLPEPDVMLDPLARVVVDAAMLGSTDRSACSSTTTSVNFGTESGA